ncbi:MAG: hypothetical protein US45_C0040G0001 [Candidatus Nomurabacteria bacterium GW2011_GWA1_37_20]|uniref:Uncharacterized protein n=1 Tax=Candidatus Nomurabacteria bacterium GW2011_GWA1_37_20 TaxID=1618729 RepID=A0A0G0J5D5_9BACT|nr:MAG: hypothetical protein US45_C0040G0001 [Candidatus Nomurabacteria bacterium GW2011_GWA1_37_20]
MAKKRGGIQKRQKVKLTVKRADELEKAWKSVNMTRFWQKIIEKIIPEVEAYRIARAKSKAQAAFVVFVSGKWQKVVPYLKSAGF